VQADNARASSRFTEEWKDGGHALENGIGARFPPKGRECRGSGTPWFDIRIGETSVSSPIGGSTE
jgi:hypothetical protein